MSLDRTERALRERLRGLRADEELAAPTFDALWRRARARARARARRRRIGFGLAATAAACVAFAVLVWRPEGVPEAPPAPAAPRPAEAWVMPLDFLLDTPGAEFLATVPRFEASLDLGSVGPAADPERRRP